MKNKDVILWMILSLWFVSFNLSLEEGLEANLKKVQICKCILLVDNSL